MISACHETLYTRDFTINSTRTGCLSTFSRRAVRAKAGAVDVTVGDVNDDLFVAAIRMGVEVPQLSAQPFAVTIESSQKGG